MDSPEAEAAEWSWGRLQQRVWTAEDGSARSTVEVVAEELGPSLRWGDGDTEQGDQAGLRGT